MPQKKPLAPPNYKRLEQKYGIKEHEYKRLVRQQNGVCFICQRDPRAFATRKYRHNLCVDHDHITGEIRGLLCRNCNSMISLIGPSLLVGVLTTSVKNLGAAA